MCKSPTKKRLCLAAFSRFSRDKSHKVIRAGSMIFVARGSMHDFFIVAFSDVRFERVAQELCRSNSDQ
jgi:hypothetical protein